MKLLLRYRVFLGIKSDFQRPHVKIPPKIHKVFPKIISWIFYFWFGMLKIIPDYLNFILNTKFL